jgi:hypothetical protein
MPQICRALQDAVLFSKNAGGTIAGPERILCLQIMAAGDAAAPLLQLTGQHTARGARVLASCGTRALV